MRDRTPDAGSRSRLDQFVSITRRVVDTVRDQRVTFLAASVAYYAFVSVIPALLLLLVVADMLFGEVIALRLLDLTSDFLTPAGQEAIETAIAGATGRSGATVIGVVVLIWSTLKVFRAIDTAFLQVYGVDERVTFLDQLADAAAVALAIGVGIAMMFVVGAVVAAVDLLPALGLVGVPALPLDVIGILVLPLLLTVVFFPMYYLLPYPHVPPLEALPGAVVAAVGWTILQTAFQVYAATAGQFQVYGVIGGILLLVTWFYLAAIVVIVGAVVNVVLATGREPDLDTDPASPRFLPGGRRDRQLQQGRGPRGGMGEEGSTGTPGDATGDDSRTTTEESADMSPRGAPDVAALDAEVARLRADLDEFESDVERRTVDRPRLESELKGYVRTRMRRGHARGWGPYLVLLYGVLLTLGAFYFLDGVWAIAAMVVLFLSTLGLYVVFIAVGIGLNALEYPGRALDFFRGRNE